MSVRWFLALLCAVAVLSVAELPQAAEADASESAPPAVQASCDTPVVVEQELVRHPSKRKRRDQYAGSPTSTKKARAGARRATAAAAASSEAAAAAAEAAAEAAAAKAAAAAAEDATAAKVIAAVAATADADRTARRRAKNASEKRKRKVKQRVVVADELKRVGVLVDDAVTAVTQIVTSTKRMTNVVFVDEAAALLHTAAEELDMLTVKLHVDEPVLVRERERIALWLEHVAVLREAIVAGDCVAYRSEFLAQHGFAKRSHRIRARLRASQLTRPLDRRRTCARPRSCVRHS
jgi:hypothetical protein